MADEEQQPAPEARAIDPERQGFGLRLKAAREHKKFTQADIALRFGVNKATVSAWETGRGAPDAFTLKALARLYDVSADALLWENSLSPAAMKIAAEYDHLPPQKQADWRVLWLGFISGAAPGGENLPMAPVATGQPEADPDQQERSYHDLLTKPRLGKKPPPKRTGEDEA